MKPSTLIKTLLPLLCLGLSLAALLLAAWQMARGWLQWVKPNARR